MPVNVDANLNHLLVIYLAKNDKTNKMKDNLQFGNIVNSKRKNGVQRTPERSDNLS